MIAANKLEKKTGVYVFEIVADQPVYNSESGSEISSLPLGENQSGQ